MKTKFLLLLGICLCLCSCGEQGLQTILRYVSAPITGVPPEIQALIWYDPDEEREKLRVIIEEGDKHPDWLADTYRYRLCMAEQQRQYYTKYIDAEGIAIIGSADVSDESFLVARDIVLRMTAKRPELRILLSAVHDYHVILVSSSNETIGELPRYTCTGDVPRTTQGVADFFQSTSKINRWQGETLVHEFAHSIHKRISTSDSRIKALGFGDPTFDDRLQKAYQQALLLGTWAGRYAETNYREYWAEGAEVWFYDILDIGHGAIGHGAEFETYADFAAHDPLLAELLTEWFPKDSFRRAY